MELRPGQKLYSAVGGAQVVVVRAPSTAVEVRCDDEPLTTEPSGAAGPQPQGPDVAAVATGDGPLMGKRYADEEVGLELLCTRTGTGALTVDGRPLAIKGAKPLPASD